MSRHGTTFRWRRCVAGCCVLTIAILATGCGGSPTPQPVGEQHLKHLPTLYMRYYTENGNKPPKNEADFKAFIKKIKPDDLKTMGIPNVDEIFVSPRDKQPYVIVWGTDPRAGMGSPGSSGPPTGGSGGAAGAAGRPPTGGRPNMARSGPTILAYEKVGEGGKRYAVMTMGGSVKEYTDEELKGYGVNLQ